jgi:hypothetical protein
MEAASSKSTAAANNAASVTTAIHLGATMVPPGALVAFMERRRSRDVMVRRGHLPALFSPPDMRPGRGTLPTSKSG